jgi:DNA polymerase-3 subunit delta'
MAWDIVGHAWAEKLLQNHIKNKHIRHAYLISGPPGIGKRTLALHFTQAITCQEPPSLGEFCGKCRPCTNIPNYAHPDLHVVEVEPHKRSLKVEKIRELQRGISLSPYEGTHRVALLFDFHMATDQAANALLKTLEEPPPQVILLLTADSPETLLPTIVSRCEQINLRPMALRDLENELVETGVEVDQAGLIARLSGGRPALAIQLNQNPTLLELRAQRLDELIALLSMGTIGRFAFVENWHQQLQRSFANLDDQRSECIEVLELWQSILRDVLLESFGTDRPLLNPNHLEKIRAISSNQPSDAIVKSIESITDTMDAVAANANIRLALETLVLDFPLIPELNP